MTKKKHEEYFHIEFAFLFSCVWLGVQQKRNDREVENLFESVKNTIEAKESIIERCHTLSQTNLPLLKIKLDESVTLGETILNRGVNDEAVRRFSLFKFQNLQIYAKKKNVSFCLFANSIGEASRS